MTGYSGTPLAKKLGLKARTALALVEAPKDYASLIAPAPEGLRIGGRVESTTDIVHVFSTRRPELERFLLSCRSKLKPEAAIWVSWRARSSDISTREITMALRFIKIAVVYLLIGALVGLGMGISQQFTLAPVHAHLLLLGWASFALVGLVYHLYPAAAETRLASIHFWLHNLGLPAFMLALGMLLTGHEGAGPFVAISAIVVILGLTSFVANVLTNVKPAS